MTTPIDASKSVAELVVEQPSLTRVFEKLGIDYCCGGKRSLKEACEKRGLDAQSVLLTLNALSGAQNGAADAETDWSRAALSELCDHIEQTHHRYLIEELPRIATLVDKVSRVHGGNHPSLHQVKEVFIGMARELLEHLQKEERMLFPMIRGLEANGSAAPMGSVAGPIQRMETEHQASGDGLESLRELTDGYTPPASACGSYRAMLSGLEDLEKDLHHHIHKENNILFPRAIEKEASLR